MHAHARARTHTHTLLNAAYLAITLGINEDNIVTTMVVTTMYQHCMQCVVCSSGLWCLEI